MRANDIAARFKQRRLELGLSLQDVADAAEMSKSTLQRYESGGIRNIPLRKLEPIAKALHTSPDWLIGWTDDANKQALLDASNFRALLRDLGYDLRIYSGGKKIYIGKFSLGDGPITEQEYLQLRDNIYAYIQFHADNLVTLAEKRDQERMKADDLILERLISLAKDSKPSEQ